MRNQLRVSSAASTSRICLHNDTRNRLKVPLLASGDFLLLNRNSGGALAGRARLAQSDYYLVDLSIAIQTYPRCIDGFIVMKDGHNTIGCALRVLDQNFVRRGFPFELHAEA